MKALIFLMHGAACAALLASSGCNRDRADASTGVLQTKFPGQVTSGGGTSGQVLARTGKPVTDGTYAGGTPGIAGGAGGTAGGTATPGTFQESGQGPNRGTSQPSSAGRPGATLPPGDMGKPPTPSPTDVQGGAATHRETPTPAAPGR
jgi:transcription elongation factor